MTYCYSRRIIFSSFFLSIARVCKNYIIEQESAKNAIIKHVDETQRKNSLAHAMVTDKFLKNFFSVRLL